jgi:hypothetical protein
LSAGRGRLTTGRAGGRTVAANPGGRQRGLARDVDVDGMLVVGPPDLG